MWDSLGVLALRLGARFLQVESRLVTRTRHAPMPRLAGFAFGGPIVPVAAPPPGRTAWRPLSWRAATLLRGSAAGLVAVGDRLRAVPRPIRSRRPDEPTRLLRVPIDDGRPPLPVSLAKLVACVLAGAIVVSAVVLVIASIVGNAIEGFAG